MAEGRVEIAPFRTITDFLTDAQFTGPAISDSNRWYNRIKQNLLYYQTNYFVVMILVVAIYSAMNPQRYLGGLFILTLLSIALSQRPKYGLLPVAAIALASGLMGHTGAVMYVVASLFIPAILTFIHASLRSRNVMNKLNTATEQLRVVPTPMGRLLEIVENKSTFMRSLAATAEKSKCDFRDRE